MKAKHKTPITLVILDGFGYRKETRANAIAAAQKPNWDNLWNNFPHSLISGSGHCVGLPDGQMGNSEVGHMNMGAGRIVNQDLTRIDAAIDSGEFFDNTVLNDAIKQAATTNKTVHILGLLSPGGVHSHEHHIHALITLAAKYHLPNVAIHAFLDGRDTPPQSAMHSLLALEAHCNKMRCGRIASLIGRYYAMDRDRRWERVKVAYDLLTNGTAKFQAPTAADGLTLAYERNETDEFVQATSIHAANAVPTYIKDGDVVIFMNFRADRAREITQALIDPTFTKFERDKKPAIAAFVCLSEYDAAFKADVAFAPESLKNILGEYLSDIGLKQLRIAETEKYAHVTFFFNGGIETPFPNEERILIPSPKVATYDLAPEMSAVELTDRLVQEIKTQQYDVIVCNFANPDMVGHTGNFEATVKAIEVIDACLGRIWQALQAVDGELVITADHGNAEKMFDFEHNQPHTAHTSDPVPFIYAGRPATICRENGKLSDIAPTLLTLLGIPIPDEMTGFSLVKLV